MTRSLAPTEHRPWPLPERPWLMHMAWRDLLFAHWPVEPERMRRLVPDALALDTFEGRAYIGVVPFLMDDVRPRGLPALPGLSRFLELNVRTYVSAGAKPGVLFFSLDAASRLAVFSARRYFHLPYFHARMACRRSAEGFRYESLRRHRGQPAAAFAARYAPAGAVLRAEPGSLDHFLTERYALYALDPAGRVLRGDVHHAPWPLQPAEAEIEVNTLLAPLGLESAAQAPLLRFARRVDVVAWRPERL